MQLIDALLPSVEQVRVPGQSHLGPLTTTFLLAMATPMVLLPLERIKKHRNSPPGAYMNERSLDGSLSDSIDEALGAKQFCHSPFFVANHWRFATMPYDGENVAEHFPDRLQDGLADPVSGQAAAEMSAEQWSSCLRNALAHGGIVYLDEFGRQAYGGRASLLAFVSARYPRGDGPQAPNQLRALRIAEHHFYTFLHEWTRWLGETGLSLRLAA